jgi:hypothetical protein
MGGAFAIDRLSSIQPDWQKIKDQWLMTHQQ